MGLNLANLIKTHKVGETADGKPIIGGLVPYRTERGAIIHPFVFGVVLTDEKTGDLYLDPNSKIFEKFTSRYDNTTELGKALEIAHANARAAYPAVKVEIENSKTEAEKARERKEAIKKSVNAIKADGLAGVVRIYHEKFTAKGIAMPNDVERDFNSSMAKIEKLNPELYTSLKAEFNKSTEA